MSALADKLRKAREFTVEHDGMKFTVRRPTDLEMLYLRESKFGRAILPFIVGWDGVTELSMLSGGTAHPVEFDSAACAEWLEDRLDILGKIAQALYDAYAKHTEKLEVAEKN
jgi:hypothetical protein